MHSLMVDSKSKQHRPCVRALARPLTMLQESTHLDSFSVSAVSCIESVQQNRFCMQELAAFT